MTPTLAEVDIITFAALEQATIVDVREVDEFAAGHVPHAQHIQLGALAASLDRIAGSDPVYVICASGNRSLKGVQILLEAGRDSISVAGGTKAWIRAGLPTERN